MRPLARFPPVGGIRSGVPTLKTWHACGLLGVGVFTAYVASPVRVQSDSIWSIPTAASILHRGDSNLDEFQPTFAAITKHGVADAGGHFYYGYPMGAVIAALPLLAPADALVGWATPLLEHLGKLGALFLKWRTVFHQEGLIELGALGRTENLVASFYVALAVVVVFLTARHRAGLGLGAALAAALLFAFGTSAYSTSSRVLWQHTPSILATACLVYGITRPRQSARSAAAIGFALAAAYSCRPTNAISVAAVLCYFPLRWRSPALLGSLLLGAVPVAVVFCGYNESVFGSLLSPYFAQHWDPFRWEVIPAFAAQFVSPSRGLLVFSPVLAWSGWEIFKRVRQRALTPEETTFVAILGLHGLAVSSYACWWAGHSIGPRFWTDVLPYFLWFLMPAVGRAWDRTARASAFRPAFWIAAGLSILIHVHASTSYDVHAWNDGPPNVDQAPSRVWDWRDPQLLRGINRWLLDGRLL